MTTIDEFLDRVFKEDLLIFAVLSGVKKGVEILYHKVDIKPVWVKEQIKYHVTYYFDQKVHHDNLDSNEVVILLSHKLEHCFKQWVFYTSENDAQILYGKKGEGKLLLKPPSRIKTVQSHNRKKQYIIKENEVCDFMVHLGIMDVSGKVIPKRYDKFRQLNKYLEFVRDSLSSFEPGKTIRIIDFGCGKAYLTFALYYYLVKQLQMDVRIVGLDLKEDVIKFCNETAKALNYEHLVFMKGDIKDFNTDDPVDMVVSLHACDTATDASLIKAVDWSAKVIFAVPCCQHELFHQINHPQMGPMLKHGITREKLSTLVTDTLRALALECRGYEVQVIEFIDMEHTPKNVLIRAYQTQKIDADALQRYEAFKTAWNTEPSIDLLVKRRIIDVKTLK